MQKLLKPPEWAEETADEPPQQHPKEDEDAGNVVGKAELGRAYHRLECSHRAGTGRARAGIAVQPRDADVLSAALIQRSFCKIGQVEIGQQGSPGLYKAPEAGKGRKLFLILRNKEC